MLARYVYGWRFAIHNHSSSARKDARFSATGLPRYIDGTSSRPIRIHSELATVVVYLLKLAKPTMVKHLKRRFPQTRTGAKRARRSRNGARGNRRRNLRIGGFLGIELKFFDSSLVATAIVSPTAAAGAELDPTTLLCLNCAPQGDTENSRDGKQISMQKISVKGMVRCAAQVDQTAGDNLPTIFLALVMDKQTNANQLASETVFDNPSGSSQTAPYPFRNLSNSKRYRVLATEVLNFQTVQSTHDGTNLEQYGVELPFEWHVDLNGMIVNFVTGGTTSVIANITDTSLHVIGYSSSTTMAPQIHYNARMRFYG